MTRREQERLVRRYLTGEMNVTEEQEFFVHVALEDDLRRMLKSHGVIDSAFGKHVRSIPTGHVASRDRLLRSLDLVAVPGAIERNVAEEIESRGSGGWRVLRRPSSIIVAALVFLSAPVVFHLASEDTGPIDSKRSPIEAPSAIDGAAAHDVPDADAMGGTAAAEKANDRGAVSAASEHVMPTIGQRLPEERGSSHEPATRVGSMGAFDDSPDDVSTNDVSPARSNEVVGTIAPKESAAIRIDTVRVQSSDTLRFRLRVGNQQ